MIRYGKFLAIAFLAAALMGCGDDKPTSKDAPPSVPSISKKGDGGTGPVTTPPLPPPPPLPGK